MKTLLFTIEYPPFKGGVANYYENLVKFWPEPDRIFVLNNNEGKLLKKFIWPHWLPSFLALRREIKQKEIDHIIVGQLLPLGTVTWLLSKIYRKKYSVILHGMDFSFAQKKWRKKFLGNLILKNSHSIICANSYVKYLVQKNLPQATQIKTVNPGITAQNADHQIIEDLKQKYQLENKIIMFTVSRLVKRKGQDQVITAMPEINKHVPNLQYFIAGDGPDRIYLEEKAKDLKNVFFIGRITDEEKLAWLEICDFFTMPTRNIDGDFDGFGIVYLEAAIAHKSVIAGESGGVKDAVQGGLTGILVDPSSVEKIANASIKLATEPETRKQLGENAYERAIRDFRWEDKIKKIYDAIVNK